jgi:hypothetical protein
MARGEFTQQSRPGAQLVGLMAQSPQHLDDDGGAIPVVVDHDDIGWHDGSLRIRVSKQQ